MAGTRAVPPAQVFTLSLSLTSVSHASLFASVSLIWMVTLALTLTLTLALTPTLTMYNRVYAVGLTALCEAFLPATCLSPEDQAATLQPNPNLDPAG